LTEPEGPRTLVLDTSMAVKFHIPEEHHAQVKVLRSALEDGRV